MVERLGETRKERRERIEKRSREWIEKRERDKRQFEEKQDLRDPPFYNFLDPALQYSHCFFKSSGYDKLELKDQNLVLQAYRMHYSKKVCHGIKRNAKVFAIG